MHHYISQIGYENDAWHFPSSCNNPWYDNYSSIGYVNSGTYSVWNLKQAMIQLLWIQSSLYVKHFDFGWGVMLLASQQSFGATATVGIA